MGFGELSDPILTRIVEEDKVPWYKKRNLRLMYLLMFPACMGIEMTTGFDGQIVNTAQIVPSWQKCKSLTSFKTQCITMLTYD